MIRCRTCYRIIKSKSINFFCDTVVQCVISRLKGSKVNGLRRHLPSNTYSNLPTKENLTEVVGVNWQSFIFSVGEKGNLTTPEKNETVGF